MLKITKAPTPLLDTCGSAPVKSGAFAAAAALAFFWRRSDLMITSSAHWVTVTASDGAVYRRVDNGRNVRVTIHAGIVDFEVGEHTDGRLIIVAVPEGEIEDLGTAFSVRVEDQRTTGLTVLQGSIVFRRVGAGALVLEAGQSCDASKRATVEAMTSDAGKGTSHTTDAPASTSAVLTAQVFGSTTAKPGAPHPIIAPASAWPSASSGSVADAEDDAFLRVIALGREGRQAAPRPQFSHTVSPGKLMQYSTRQTSCASRSSLQVSSVSAHTSSAPDTQSMRLSYSLVQPLSSAEVCCSSQTCSQSMLVSAPSQSSCAVQVSTHGFEQPATATQRRARAHTTLG